MRMLTALATIASAMVASIPLTAAAQERTDETLFVTGSGAGATPVANPYADSYGFGAVGGAGIYHSLAPQLSLGARLDAGGIANEEDEGPNVGTDTLGFGALSPALRLRPFGRERNPERATGLWLEAAGGPGVVEDEIKPVIAPGLGYIFEAGDVGIGPTARYMQAIGNEGLPEGEDVRIGTVGIELVLFDERRPRRSVDPMREYAPPQPLVPAARLETPAERQARQQRARDTDGDGFYDQDDRCPEQAEVFNGMNDHDGCPDSQQASVVDNRIVIDERVFFDYDEATLRPEGKQQLDEIVRLYQAEGDDWSRLRVAGHADRRGPEPYNMDLSRQRAAAVRGYLIEQGVPESLIDIEAYGENRPLIPDANIPAEFQMNRRVEFMVER